MKTHWTILGEDGRKPLLFRLSNYSEPIDGQGYNALVAAHDRVLANFSRDIVTSMNDILNEVSHR